MVFLWFSYGYTKGRHAVYMSLIEHKGYLVVPSSGVDWQFDDSLHDPTHMDFPPCSPKRMMAPSGKQLHTTISGWWFETLWKIWLRQFWMMNFPICGKMKKVPNHQPDMEHHHIFLYLLWLINYEYGEFPWHFLLVYQRVNSCQFHDSPGFSYVFVVPFSCGFSMVFLWFSPWKAPFVSPFFPLGPWCPLDAPDIQQLQPSPSVPQSHEPRRIKLLELSEWRGS